ncbi:hypothetical protein IBY51_21145, partial [Escherichia coli]
LKYRRQRQMCIRDRDNDAPKPYQAGTWGPVASVAMITRDGRSWNEFE